MALPSPSAEALSLLAELYRARRTGVLSVGPEDSPLRVQLTDGQIVALGPARVEPPAAPTTPSPNDSVRMRLERVLAEIGMRPAVPVPGLEPQPAGSPGSLRDQLIERLVDESCPPRFEEGAEPLPDAVAVVVATEPLILEAVRQLRSADLVRAGLGDLDQRLVATAALAEERTLTLTEGYLLSRIDGLVSVREVLQLVPLDPDETERALLGLLLTGRVQCRPAPAARPQPAHSPAPAATPAAPPPDETAPAEPAPGEGIDTSADIEAEPIEEEEAPPAPAPRPPLDPATIERRREILDLFQSLPLKNHFEVLGVEPGCSDAEVRRAYVALAKRFHPDAHRDARLEDLHDILEAIFIRVGEAWEVLGEAKSRASYEKRSGIVRRPRPVEPVEPVQPKAPAAPATAPLTSRAAAAPPAPPPQPTRGEYVPPEETLYRAQQLLVQARYWDAIQLLESALPAMEPRRHQHRGRLLLARAYSKNPNWLRRAEETLHDVVREDPTNADAHYELGLVYKSGGLAARAHSMFRRALELRPGHKEAAAELGIQQEEGGGGGLLKRLFGRGKAS